MVVPPPAATVVEPNDAEKLALEVAPLMCRAASPVLLTVNMKLDELPVFTIP